MDFKKCLVAIFIITILSLNVVHVFTNTTVELAHDVATVLKTTIDDLFIFENNF